MANRLPQRKQHTKERPKAQRAERSPDSRLYNDRRWKALSTRLREQAHWMCEQCSRAGDGRTIVVDHIVPHRGDVDLFWSVDNMMVLCADCHNKKTARGE